MLVLLDTNILLRLAVPVHPMHMVARDAVIKLQAKGDRLVIVPQNIYEYWVVATRPIPNNGLGFNTKHTESTVDAFLETFSLLRDERGIFPLWQDLVRSMVISGKLAHDCRIAAAMIRHNVNRILTFNVSDFSRFVAISPVDPSTL
jgi:predicted nucleic acid-binding protein